MVASAIDAAQNWYRQACPHYQLIRGDGPELFAQGGVISGMTDWGGVRFGSVVDDIGCWTLHGATRDIRRYTTDFVRGYRSTGALSPEEERAMPMFQRLRLASRAVDVTDHSALAVLEQWMERIK